AGGSRPRCHVEAVGRDRELGHCPGRAGHGFGSRGVEPRPRRVLLRERRRVSLADKFAAAGAEVAPPVRVTQQPHPRGWEPGVRYESGVPGEATVTVKPGDFTQEEKGWRAAIKQFTGLVVPEDRRVELVDTRYWGNPEAPMVYARFRIVDRGTTHADIDALVKAAKQKRRKAAAKPPTGGAAFVVAIGDTQLGKVDGGGTEATIGRVLASTDAAVRRLKMLRKHGTGVGPVYLLWLGDCIEGRHSQGGALVWRTDLTTTEQVRVLRRLMVEQVKAFAPLAERVVLASVPGNHDEASRTAGRMDTRYDDSWAVDAASAVGDALALAGGYEHVSVVVPARDELTITLDIGGTITTLAHGHQMRPGKAHQWWADQAHGMQDAGQSTLLLTGHLHHLAITRPGRKTHVQVPAMDGGSTWWRHRTGADSPAGVVTLLVSDGGWSDLQVV